jgi:hypothetical protein
MRAFLLPTAAVLALTLAGFSPAQARVQCIPVNDIVQTPVIDGHTILVKLRHRGHYKRLDLSSGCGDIVFDGFAHRAFANQLCNTDPIFTSGGFCMINEMVDINEDEAKQLLKKRR